MAWTPFYQSNEHRSPMTVLSGESTDLDQGSRSSAGATLVRKSDEGRIDAPIAKIDRENLAIGERLHGCDRCWHAPASFGSASVFPWHPMLRSVSANLIPVAGNRNLCATPAPIVTIAQNAVTRSTAGDACWGFFCRAITASIASSARSRIRSFSRTHARSLKCAESSSTTVCRASTAPATCKCGRRSFAAASPIAGALLRRV